MGCFRCVFSRIIGAIWILTLFGCAAETEPWPGEASQLETQKTAAGAEWIAIEGLRSGVTLKEIAIALGLSPAGLLAVVTVGPVVFAIVNDPQGVFERYTTFHQYFHGFHEPEVTVRWASAAESGILTGDVSGSDKWRCVNPRGKTLGRYSSRELCLDHCTQGQCVNWKKKNKKKK